MKLKWYIAAAVKPKIVGSSPIIPAMVTFKFNGKQYTTNNLESKLKKLNATINDIELMGSRDLGEIDNSIKLYYFINRTNGYRCCSIYSNCPKDYEPCTREIYETIKRND